MELKYIQMGINMKECGFRIIEMDRVLIGEYKGKN